MKGTYESFEIASSSVENEASIDSFSSFSSPQTQPDKKDRKSSEPKSAKQSRSGLLKNNFPNIVRRVVKMMTGECRPAIEAFFRKLGRSYDLRVEDLMDFCQKILRNNCSGRNFGKMLSSTNVEPKEKRVRSIFVKQFLQILRRRYILLSVKGGRMKELESYTESKNTEIMYFWYELCLINRGA